MTIQPIVEGHGEIAAIRELLGRLMALATRWDFQVARPIRQNSSKLLKPDGIADAVAIARQTENLAGIVIFFDGDIDLERSFGTYSCFCPKTDLPPLVASAKAAASPIFCDVVVPYKEYETWLLAGLEGLIESGDVLSEAVCPANLEQIRGAKGRLASLMAGGSYLPTTHQVPLTCKFDMRMAYRRTRSFKKLMKSFADLHASNGLPLENWPPAGWINEEWSEP